MSTMNISLPSEHVSFVDKLVHQYGFSNRSEFFRALLRLVKQKPTLVKEASTFFPLEPPKIRSRKKIIEGMRKTGKYSEEFLKDLEFGLKQSDYFQE